MAPIAAGTWHLVGDGEGISQTVTVKFDILWRHGGTDTTLATATHTFPPSTSTDGFNTVPFETDLTGAAAAAQAGDQLVLRFTNMAGGIYIPNGDAAADSARDPNLTLP